MTNTERRIIWTMTDEYGDMLLSIAKRHLKLAKRALESDTSVCERAAIQSEIEALRQKRQSIMGKYKEIIQKGEDEQ